MVTYNNITTTSIYESLYQRLTIQFSPKFQGLLYHSNQKQPVANQVDLLRAVLTMNPVM